MSVGRYIYLMTFLIQEIMDKENNQEISEDLISIK